MARIPGEFVIPGDMDGIRFCNVPDNLGDVSVKWPMKDLQVYASGMFGAVSLADAIEHALSGWNDVCGIRLTMSTNPRTAHLVVGVGRIDGPGNVLAQNELPVGFSGSRGWRQLTGLYDFQENVVLADNPPSGKLDAGRICRHELGHFLGVGHITEGNLMAPMYSSRIALPQRGDILEVLARYPRDVAPPATPTPSPVPTPPSSNDIVMSDTFGKRYRWVGWQEIN